MPPEGLLLSDKLAKLLGASAGDRVTVEVLEGRRPVRDIQVAAIFSTYLGTPAYMRLDALNQLMREAPSISGSYILADNRQKTALNAVLKDMPKVAGVTQRDAAIAAFRKTIGETMYIMVGFYVMFSCLLAFGVVYNSVRISLSERGRELASLRVLGLTRFEISYILLGELATLDFSGAADWMCCRLQSIAVSCPRYSKPNSTVFHFISSAIHLASPRPSLSLRSLCPAFSCVGASIPST